MATSVGTPVCCMSPRVWMRSVAASRVPRPTCCPVGTWYCCVGLPTGRMVWYKRSSNSARPRLKPEVFTFARLLAITSMRVCCASIPVAAVESARNICLLLLSPNNRGACGASRSGNARQVLRGGPIHLAKGLDHAVQRVVLPRRGDDLGHGPQGVDVGHLQVLIQHRRLLRRRRRPRVGARHVDPVAAVIQGL